jgi:hypothetical protein
MGIENNKRPMLGYLTQICVWFGAQKVPEAWMSSNLINQCISICGNPLWMLSFATIEAYRQKCQLVCLLLGQKIKVGFQLQQLLECGSQPLFKELYCKWEI